MNFWRHLFGPLALLFIASSVLTWGGIHRPFHAGGNAPRAQQYGRPGRVR